MASPLLYHVKVAPLAGVAARVSTGGAALAAVGLLYEAVADQQKSLHKIGLRADGKPDSLYTRGVYSNSRHANYAGEIAFWAGSFVAGAPAIFAAGAPLYVRALRALCSGLGLAGIVFIMLSATKRLEGRQADKWGSTAEYKQYLDSSNSLFPKLF
jgi:steroid 5-alpha reductase family enzyme